jgi:hypothetical protein
VWIFCVVDRYTVDQLVEKGLEQMLDSLAAGKMAGQPEQKFECLARPELGRFPIPFQDRSEWLDFVELTLADWWVMKASVA